MRWMYAIVAPIEWLIWLFAESFASLFAKAMESNGFDDPVYKRNLQKLIERNRRLEETRE
jgi:hypothetical protein